MNPIQSHPIPSHPTPFHPPILLSHPNPTHPILPTTRLTPSGRWRLYPRFLKITRDARDFFVCNRVGDAWSYDESLLLNPSFSFAAMDRWVGMTTCQKARGVGSQGSMEVGFKPGREGGGVEMGRRQGVGRRSAVCRGWVVGCALGGCWRRSENGVRKQRAGDLGVGGKGGLGGRLRRSLERVSGREGE